MKKDIVKEMPKVLVCTINSWNSKIGDNTFQLLLEQIPADNLASVFIREDTPDSPACNNYFRISEGRVIKSILNRRTVTGEKVTTNENDSTNAKEQQIKLYQTKNRNYYLKLFLREIVWKFGKWKTKELDDFIAEFSPDVIVYEMSRYIHLNNIVKYILKRSGAKGIGCFWDDTFTYKQEKLLGFKMLRYFQRKNLKKLASATTSFFAITEKTKCEADEFFGINCTVLTKPVLRNNDEFKEYEPNTVIKLLYTGNLGIGRFETIKLIGDALNEINQKNTKIEIDVYSATFLSEEKLKSLGKYVHFLGTIPQTQIPEIQSKADVLVFAESIDGANDKIARLSFSTKLTDYFSAGKCILAIGNSDTAPMEYLKENEAALTASSYEEIIAALKFMVANKQTLLEYAKKSFDLGRKNHNKEDIQQKMMSAILS